MGKLIINDKEIYTPWINGEKRLLHIVEDACFPYYTLSYRLACLFVITELQHQEKTIPEIFDLPDVEKSVKLLHQNIDDTEPNWYREKHIILSRLSPNFRTTNEYLS